MAQDASSARARPLEGKRIVVTRAEDGAGALAGLLREHGAVVLELPLVKLLPPLDPLPLKQATAQLYRYDWVVFTSGNAVRALRTAIAHARAPTHQPRVAAVGDATARVIAEELGWHVDAVPAAFAGDQVAAAMQAVAPLARQRVLWPRAAAARTELARQLEAAGAIVDAPEAYRTEAVPEAAAQLARSVHAGEVDAVIFTAPSAVRSYAAARGPAAIPCVAVIGPTTAAAAVAEGMRVHVQPEQHTFPALVDALARHFGASHD